MVKWQSGVTSRFLTESDKGTDAPFTVTESGKEKERDLKFPPEDKIKASVSSSFSLSLDISRRPRASFPHREGFRVLADLRFRSYLPLTRSYLPLTRSFLLLTRSFLPLTRSYLPLTLTQPTLRLGYTSSIAITTVCHRSSVVSALGSLLIVLQVGRLNLAVPALVFF